MGRRTESKPVSLIKQNDPKQNQSSPASLKKRRGLMAANNNIYGTIRIKWYDKKCKKCNNV